MGEDLPAGVPGQRQLLAALAFRERYTTAPTAEVGSVWALIDSSMSGCLHGANLSATNVAVAAGHAAGATARYRPWPGTHCGPRLVLLTVCFLHTEPGHASPRARFKRPQPTHSRLDGYLLYTLFRPPNIFMREEAWLGRKLCGGLKIDIASTAAGLRIDYQMFWQ